MTLLSPTRRAWVVPVVLVAGFLAGLLVQRTTQAEPRHVREEPAQPAAPTPTKQGAVDTATAYVMSLRWDVLIDDRRRLAAVRAFAEPDAAQELDADLAAHVEPIRAAVTSSPVVARRAILGTRVEYFEPPDASVSLWGLAVFATGSYGPVAQWSTSRFDLEWRDNRWRVAAVKSEGGPSPESSLNRLARADAEFDEVSRVP